MAREASPYEERHATGNITTATTTEIIAGIANKKLHISKLIMSYDSALTVSEWQLKEGSTVLFQTQFAVGPDHAIFNLNLLLSVGEGLDLLTQVHTGTTPSLNWYVEYEIR